MPTLVVTGANRGLGLEIANRSSLSTSSSPVRATPSRTSPAAPALLIAQVMGALHQAT